MSNEPSRDGSQDAFEAAGEFIGDTFGADAAKRIDPDQLPGALRRVLEHGHVDASDPELIDAVADGIERTFGSQKPIRNEEERTGRNAPCPCGSGKKYKQCCGRKR